MTVLCGGLALLMLLAGANSAFADTSEPSAPPITAQTLDLAVNARAEARGWANEGLVLARLGCDAAEQRVSCRYVIDGIHIVATAGGENPAPQLIVIRPATKLWRSKRRAIAVLVDALSPTLDEAGRDRLTDKLTVAIDGAETLTHDSPGVTWAMRRLPQNKMAFILVTPANE